MSTSIEKLHSIPDIAESLGVTKEKVRAWIKAGELKAINTTQNPNGRARYRVRPEAFEDFLERRASTPPVPKQRRRKKSNAPVTEFY